MKKIISKDQIIINSNFESINEIFHKISTLAVENGVASDQKVLEKALKDREAQTPTGLEKGFAIPHAISDTVKKPTVYIIINKKEIDWKTIDNTNKVKYVFCLLVPKKATDAHLKLLAALAVRMNDDQFCKLITNAKVDQIIDTINKIDIEKDSKEETKNTKKSKTTSKEFIIGVTSCAAGIAHTYMAKDKLVQACEKNGWKHKIETRGSIGPENVLTRDDIEKATLVVIASDLKIDLQQFKGKKIIEVDTNAAIRNSEQIINRGLKSKNISQSANQGNSDDDNMIFNLSSKNKNPIMKALMTAIGYMIPITITGGILMAIPDIIAAHGSAANGGQGGWHFPNHFIAGWFQVGAVGLKLMLPIFGMYLAYAIAGRSAMPAGLIGTYVINDPSILKQALPQKITDWLDHLNGVNTAGGFNVQAGFLGAIAVGFFVGYLVQGLKWINFPKIIKPVVPIMVIPVLSTFITYVFVIYVAALPLTFIMSEFFILLHKSSHASQVVLPLIGMLFAAMIAFDLGGPFNKTALLVATAIFVSAVNQFPTNGESFKTMSYSDIVPQTATQAAISVPPLGAWIATVLFKKKFSVQERTTGKAAFGMGLVGISEGAIPFAITNPLRAVLANVIGAAVAGGMVVLFGCRFVAGLGSPIGTFAGYIPSQVPYAGWILSTLTGSIITALIFGFSRPRVVEYEEVYNEEKVIRTNAKNLTYKQNKISTTGGKIWYELKVVFKIIFMIILTLLNPKKWFKDPKLVGDPITYKINKSNALEGIFNEKYQTKITNLKNVNSGFDLLIEKDQSETGKKRLIKNRNRNNIKLLKLENLYAMKKVIINFKTINKIKKLTIQKSTKNKNKLTIQKSTKKKNKFSINKTEYKNMINKLKLEYKIQDLKIKIQKWQLPATLFNHSKECIGKNVKKYQNMIDKLKS